MRYGQFRPVVAYGFLFLGGRGIILGLGLVDGVDGACGGWVSQWLSLL